jgi:hypothetical protein
VKREEMAALPPSTPEEMIQALRVESAELRRRRQGFVSGRLSRIDPSLSGIEYQEAVLEFALLESRLTQNEEMIRGLESRGKENKIAAA